MTTIKFPLSSTSNLSSLSIAFPQRIPVAFFLLLIFSFASSSLGASVEGNGEVVEPVPEQESQKPPAVAILTSGSSTSRVKRSRDVQQLCGYRLLDALRSVCDRNFVGFTRRSDPSLIIQAGDGQSGEEFDPMSAFPFSGANLSPWEVLAFELPSGNSQVVVKGDDDVDSSSVPHYFELLQQEAPSNLWPSSSYFGGRNNGGYGMGSGSNTSGNKALALKMLTDPPKTHQRFRRNIIDECCKKPCAMHQMLKYCAITAVGKRAF